MIYVCLILACIGLSLWAFVSLCEWLWAPSRDKWAYSSWHLNNWPINLNITSEEVIAKPRKLKTTWSLEAAEDLRTMWNDEAERDLVNHYAHEMLMMVDQDVIASLSTWADNTLALIENRNRGSYNSMFLRDLAEIEHQDKWRRLHVSQ